MGTTYVQDSGQLLDDMESATGISKESIKGHYFDGEFLYVATKLTDGKVMAFAILVHKDREDKSIGFKEIDEGMMPYAFNCPKRIIKMLSPSDELYEVGSSANNYSKEWRSKQLK